MRNKLKVSLITTERNEKDNIDGFIDSVLIQSSKPDEIVIADAGSTDGTIDRIKERIKAGDPIKLVVAKGNRSVGRNAAIKTAKYPLIAVTDVGCELDKDWLKNIISPILAGSNEVVAGFFQPKAKSYFEKVSTLLMTESKNEIDLKNWLPSSRSIAFTKRAWEKAGGYPEYEEFGDNYIAKMCGGEDTLFDLRLKDAGFEFGDGLKAIAYWRPRKNIIEFYRQYWMYSVGDGIRLVDNKHYYRLLTKYLLFILIFTLLLFFFPLWLVAAFLLTYVYFFKRAYSKWVKMKGVKSAIMMPLLLLTYDLAQIFGFYRGVLARLKIPKQLRVKYKSL